MKIKSIPSLLLCLSVSAASPAAGTPAVPEAAGAARSGTFNVRDFGAAGDGKTSDTGAIRSAAEACRDNGGGTLLFPPGVYVTGTFRLYGHTTVLLEAGSVVLGSPDTSDYGHQSEYGLSGSSSAGVSGSGAGHRTGLLVARDAEDIVLSGPGVMDGNGDGFFDFSDPHRGMDFDPSLTRQGGLFVNPRYGLDDGPFLAKAGWDERPGTLAVFWNCRDVRLDGVTFRNAPNWTVHFQDCDGVSVSGVVIRNSLLLPNDDGIDVYDSRNVRISDCLIRSGDDCIAVIGSRNTAVSNCILRSRSAGIRIGYGTRDVRDCVFQNVVIDTSTRGVGIFVRGAGSVENVFFSNLLIRTRLVNGSWWGRGEPIHLSVLPFGDAEPGRIQNVRFNGVSAEGESGVIVYGFRDGSIRDVALNGIRLRIGEGPNGPLTGGNFDLRPSGPAATSVFRHDIPAFFGRGVRHLRISDLDLEWMEPAAAYFSGGIECENVEGLVLEGFTGRQAGRTGSAVRLDSCRSVTIRDCRALRGTDVFLDLSGPPAEGWLVRNDLSSCVRAIRGGKNGFRIDGNRFP
jgi:parallel beta-helix repeat protein